MALRSRDLLGLALALLFASSIASAEVSKTRRTELTAVPLFGGDSDVGLGGGYILSHARLSALHPPFLWRLESAGFVTFKPARRRHGVQVPYVDEYLLLHLPQAVPRRLELQLRLSFTREATLKFAGLGNASELAPGHAPGDPYYRHGRTHPTGRFSAVYHLNHTVDASWGMSYTYNWLDIPSGTLLAQKLRSGSSDERSLLVAARNHGNAQLSIGIAHDTRDSEINTRSGLYITARTDLSPGGVRELPSEWARAMLAAHGYIPLLPRRLTLAARLATDLLLGDAPLYELPRFEDTFFGGVNGIRGVPGQRYWGKIKLLGNLELRSELLPFRFWSKRHVLGVTLFFDSGRLWSGFSSHPGLDGDSLGLKFGTGAGLRLAAGDSFVLRADLAYSPDAHPIGAYLTAGQMF